jgi:hypothetical protein
MFAESIIRANNSNNSAALSSLIRINRIAIGRASSTAPANPIMQPGERRIRW